MYRKYRKPSFYPGRNTITTAQRSTVRNTITNLIVAALLKDNEFIQALTAVQLKMDVSRVEVMQHVLRTPNVNFTVKGKTLQEIYYLGTVTLSHSKAFGLVIDAINQAITNLAAMYNHDVETGVTGALTYASIALLRVLISLAMTLRLLCSAFVLLVVLAC